MSLGALVYDALANDAGIAAIVGTRVYPLLLPQDSSYPALSYQRIDNSPQQGSTVLREARYQINCWAQRYAQAQTLATAVKAMFEGYSDTDQTPSIKMGQIVNELDDYDPDANVYRVIIDVIFVTAGD